MSTKKKFKETKAGKGLKALLNIGMDVLPIPDVRRYFDKDQDGKYTLADLRHFKWFEFAGAVVLFSLLIYFEIIDMAQLKELIKFIVTTLLKT